MDLICRCCKTPHDGSYGSGVFCSRSCANKRNHSPEVRAKISKSVSVAHSEGRLKPYRDYVKTPEEYEEYIAKRAINRAKKLLDMPFSEVSLYSLKERIRLEQSGKCKGCGLDSWLDRPLTLELEHKDGDNQNNARSNLECLCPNCHSQTDTWRGRNINRGRKRKVSDEKICRTFLKSKNIKQTLTSLGLTPKGSNYGRVKRCLTQAGISYEHTLNKR